MLFQRIDALDLKYLEALLPAVTGVRQRQLDVGYRRSPWDQVETLEDESDLLVAQVGESIVVDAADIDAVEQIAALSRGIEAPQQVHQGRLS